MSLADDLHRVGARAHARQVARRRHELAAEFLAREAGPAFEHVHGVLETAGISAIVEQGRREVRLMLEDGQSLRLTLHTSTSRYALWLEAQSFPSFVASAGGRLWSRRWSAGCPTRWDRDRVVAVVADWYACLADPPVSRETLEDRREAGETDS